MLWADQMSEFVLCSFRCQDLFRCKIHGRGADHRQRITEAVYPKVEHSMKATSWLSRGGLGIDFIVLAQHGRGAQWLQVAHHLAQTDQKSGSQTKDSRSTISSAITPFTSTLYSTL